MPTRTASYLLALICALLANNAIAQVVETSRPIELRASDRPAVEKVACIAHGAKAIGIQGWVGYLLRGHPLGASVLCNDGVETPGYREVRPLLPGNGA